MHKNIVLCGVGGQGIVLTSKLLAAAAMEKNLPVMSAETIGMAQKGGSVFSFLRMGEDLHCPMFPRRTADILIGFEPAEAVRMLPYLKPDGHMILNTHPIQPVTATLNDKPYDASEMVAYLQRQTAHLTQLDGSAACAELGTPKALNMVMLGAVLETGVLPLTLEEIQKAMEHTVKPRFHDMNRRALRYCRDTLDRKDSEA